MITKPDPTEYSRTHRAAHKAATGYLTRILTAGTDADHLPLTPASIRLLQRAAVSERRATDELLSDGWPDMSATWQEGA